MRQIATIPDEAQARTLADYLLTLGIATKLDRHGGQWLLWARDEDRVPRALEETDAFLRSPDDPKYRAAASAARVVREQETADQREHERQSVDLRDRWLYRSPRKIPATLALIAWSVVIYIAVDLSPLFGERLESSLFITANVAAFREQANDWNPAPWREHLEELREIRQGHVWRLVTPIFLHSRIIIFHLLFNMFWLADLGSQIESLRGSLRFALLVIVTAAISNLAQYLVAGPAFGGMSGVVYALFGYTWMRVRYEPEGLFRMRSNTVPTMLLWLLLCMTGVLGPIADAAHVAGLLAGMAIGVAPFARDALRPW